MITAWAIAALLLSQAAPAQPLPAGHPAILPPGAPGQGAPPSANDLLQKLDGVKGLKDQDKPFDVASAVGKLYFGNGRFDDAQLFFRQALAKAEPLRSLFLSQKAKADGKHQALPDPASVGCVKASGQNQALTEKAQALAAKGQSGAAAACAKVALGPALEVQSLLGDALFLTGDSKGALEQHAQVLAIDPKDPNSLYGHAGVLFDGANDDLKTLALAKAEFTRYLELYPALPHAEMAKAMLQRADQAIAAGGISKLPHPRLTGPLPARAPMQAPMMAGPMQGGPMQNGAPPALTQDQIAAVQNTERTPELMEGLQKLIDQGEDALAHGQFQEALDDYKRVVPFQPDNGRAKAGMAWALVGMNRQPMADRIWQVAVGADPAAVDQLGESLKAKGDTSGAKALWAKLAQTAPDYAAKANLQGKL
jgi:tetratricopeptide (TPR) repeat protein